MAKGAAKSQLLIDLLEGNAAQATLSLVAEYNNEITGNIVFSPAKISYY